MEKTHSLFIELKSVNHGDFFEGCDLATILELVSRAEVDNFIVVKALFALNLFAPDRVDPVACEFAHYRSENLMVFGGVFTHLGVVDEPA